MTGVVCDHYNSCLVTPQQSFPNNFQTHGNDGFLNCVSYVPCQQGGLIVGNNYNFSEGYSIDPCCNYNPNLVNQNNEPYNNNFNYNGNYNFSNDYSFSDGLNFQHDGLKFAHNEPNNNSFQETHSKDTESQKPEKDKQFLEVHGTEVPPQGFNEEAQQVPLTPSFFASNSSFKRIPLNPGRSIFRRRKPGDCASEWSNAFDKDYDDGVFFGQDQ